MDLQGWWSVLSGLGGLVVAGYGVWLLMTGRMTARTRRGWSRPVDAGMWFLCVGLFLMLLAVGYLGVHSGAFGLGTGWALMALAFAFFALGLIKYRPRHSKSGGSWT